MTVSSDYVDQNLFDASGHTGATYYYRIVGNRSSLIWHPVAEVMAASVPWATSVIALPEMDDDGEFPVTIPGALPAGCYDIIVYHQTGSEPANTDDVEKQWTTTKGDIFGF